MYHAGCNDTINHFSTTYSSEKKYTNTYNVCDFSYSLPCMALIFLDVISRAHGIVIP